MEAAWLNFTQYRGAAPFILEGYDLGKKASATGATRQSCQHYFLGKFWNSIQ
jgi:hypothetical protein